MINTHYNYQKFINIYFSLHNKKCNKLKIVFLEKYDITIFLPSFKVNYEFQQRRREKAYFLLLEA